MSATWAALLTGAAARLKAEGIADPMRDARLLMADAAGIAPGRVTLAAGDTPEPAVRAAFEAAIARRAAREPVSRILGTRAFWGRRFRVTRDVLDPRPETETLVAAALEAPFARVLDLGIGSGCILVTLLAERPDASGVGSDTSSAALLVAGQNAAAHGVDARALLTPSDWFADLGGRYDLIVSNPPYIAADEMPGLAPEVRDHDPHAALTDGADGLSAYRAIAAGAPPHLAPGGRVLVEIGARQGPAVAAIFRAAGFREVAIRPDLDGRDRVVAARDPAD